MVKRIALIGGAGLIGRALIRRFSMIPGISLRVIDLHPPVGMKVDFFRQDICEGNWAALLEGCDALIHLAAHVNPPRPQALASFHRLHEQGALQCIAAARSAGVRKLVLCSSAVVYGARPSSPFPLTELHPVRPNPDFPYAKDKAKQEEIFLAQADSFDVAIARPAIVYAAGARNYLTEMLRFAPGILPAIDGCRPPLQFVHVDDVAAALSLLAIESVAGIYNVCPQDWLSFQEVGDIANLRVMAIRKSWMAPLLDATYSHLPGWGRAPSYILPYLQYSFVLSGAKLTRELNHVPRYTSEDALRFMLSRKLPFLRSGL